MQFSEKLAAVSMPETPENIANKISCGEFSAIYLFQSLEVVGSHTLRLEI